MVDGPRYSGAVDVTAADPEASATDFLPLDDSDSSDAQHLPLNGPGGNDSASDVSMEAQSEDEEDTNLPAPHIQTALADSSVSATSQLTSNSQPDGGASKKRKSPEDSSQVEIRSNTLDPAKKRRLEQSEKDSQGDEGSRAGSKVDRSTLPAEIWHHIFSFCPPRILGRLLCVNRLFNLYLDPSSKVPCDRPQSLSSGVLPLLQPTAIWQASRRGFWPSMPSPLQEKTELDMWQLSGSTTCQHCCKQGIEYAKDLQDPWHSGPGKDGVSIIWAFATRSCGDCLLAKSTKEIDILLSSTIPSTLAAALPFVFVTQELHVISPTTMERNQAPPNMSLTKLFWSEHVEAIKQEFFSVKAMGAATAEEWLKGLEGRGHECRSDASRWENWAATNSLSQMRNLLYPGYRPSPAVPLSAAMGPRTVAGSASIVQIPGLNHTNNYSRTATPSITSSQRNGITPDPFRRSSTGTASFPPGRHERTKEEVAELKAARKAEIERRALALDPPLRPSILAHIPSFQAALQIITPLDEQAWELLKSRLLAQRADAEQREKENPAQATRQQETDDKRNCTSAANKEVRDAVDADWDEVQAPVRARIAGFADEIIRDGWGNGDKVDRNNCSKFAVEVLTYIRKRFYAEVAKDAAAARASGTTPTVDPPQGPFTQKLTLENMKWVFDIKIKPHTERHRKEIFLCNGCEVTVRYYGFEGVIQHFAAKHTTTLSIGNVVVHWRAEWPEQPPFTSEPRTAKNGFFQGQPPPAHNSIHRGLSTTPSQPYQAHPKGPAQLYVAAPSYSETFPPGPHHSYPAQGYGTHPFPAADHYQHQTYPAASANPSGYSGPLPAPPGPPGAPGPPAPYNHNYGAYQANGQIGYQAVPPSTFSPQYRTQLEDMARMARELWNATSNMKDTLSIVRVQVVIHHLAKRFHARFGINLPLATFIDGLSDHKDMRPVRNVNGLVCRVCHQGVGGYVASEEERRTYSLPQLTTHFQSKHVEPFVQMGQYGHPPEWTVDMVLLPDPAAVSNLRSAVSMDSQKFHLVNEAVPHLLGPFGIPEAAPGMAPAYPGQTGYNQGYQSAPADDHATYYGQAQASGPAENTSTGLYQNSVVAPTHYPSQPSALYDHAGPSMVGANSVPSANGHVLPEPVAPAPAPAPAPVPLLMPVNMSLNRESERQSSQGFRQRDQGSRPNKKKNRKGANGHDGDSLKRSEEEDKMAEEEAEREGDAIRAMWAADRAQTARKSAVPESDRAEKLAADNTPSCRNTPSSSAAHNTAHSKAPQRTAHGGRAKHGSKPGTPQQRPRFQSRPRDSPGTDPPEPRAEPGGPLQRQAAYRGHQHRLSNVIYMDGDRDEPEDYGQFNRPPPRDSEPHRSRSPVYTDYGQPPTQQYRQRSPVRPGHDYQYLPPAAPLDDVRYERPLPRNDYSYRSYQDEPARRQRPPQEVIEIEIIEYRRPDGTTWVEERPLRRIPNPDPERYYRDVPPPASSYDRGNSYAAGPPRHEQPPLPAQMVNDAYRPPYERGYSRTPQGPPPQPPAGGGYDPRHPSDAAPRQFQAQPLLQRHDATYFEEYDPRFPAGVPPHSAPIPAASRTARYQ